MTLAVIRAEKGLSLEGAAVALGLSAKSKSWISDIENGKRDASVLLALRIEAWSDGRVPASSVCKRLKSNQGVAPSVEETATLAPPAAFGAGAKSGEVQ